MNVYIRQESRDNNTNSKISKEGKQQRCMLTKKFIFELDFFFIFYYLFFLKNTCPDIYLVHISKAEYKKKMLVGSVFS